MISIAAVCRRKACGSRQTTRWACHGHWTPSPSNKAHSLHEARDSHHEREFVHLSVPLSASPNSPSRLAGHSPSNPFSKHAEGKVARDQSGTAPLGVFGTVEDSALRCDPGEEQTLAPAWNPEMTFSLIRGHRRHPIRCKNDSQRSYAAAPTVSHRAHRLNAVCKPRRQRGGA